MTQKRKSGAFFGGVPTDVDIKKIREQYPDSELKEGQIIPYQKIEQILQEPKNSNRWLHVTNRWRKLVEHESGIIIGVERGEGFKVIDDEEKVDLCGAKLKSAVKAAKRSYEVGSQVDANRLTEDSRLRLDFFTNKNAKIIAVGQVRTNISLPTM